MDTHTDTMFDISETVTPDELAMLTELEGNIPTESVESWGVPLSIQGALGWMDFQLMVEEASRG